MGFMSPYSIGFIAKAVVLMASGIYFFIRYFRQGPPVWIGVILMTTGFFDLRFQLELWQEAHALSPLLQLLLQGSILLMMVGANTLYHYFVLIFYLETSGHIKRYMYGLLLVPVLVALLRTGLDPGWRFDYRFAAILGSAYWLASLALAVQGIVQERRRDNIIYHLALALILLSNGLILIVAHGQGKEFIDLVNLTSFSVFLGVCLLLLIWVNMRKMLLGMQRDAVVRKVDMGTALLHHSFKNAIGKVKINAWNIRNSLSKLSGDPAHVEEIDGYVQNLFSTYEHMMGLMARIAQMVGNRVHVKPEPVDVAELLDAVADTIGHLPDVRVVKRYGPMHVDVDRALILECLVNVVDNAIDAMHGAGTLTLAAEKRGRTIVVAVTDTGPGLDQEQIPQVFEPFYSTKGKTGKNMGLGLYYVHNVMTAHRGHVSVHSEPGKGTTVKLHFRHGRKRLWRK